MEIVIPYKAHRTQRPFHQDRLTHTWRAIIAGTGSGKTYAGAAEAIFWSAAYPGCVGVIFSPTYSMIKRNVIPKLEAFLGAPIESSPLIDSFHKGDMVINWATGSKTWLVSLEYPERAEGQSIDWAWIDEFRLVRDVELSLMVIQRRLRGSGCGCPIGAWITTTPNHPGSDLHLFLEDPEHRNPDSQVYRMSLLDNRDNLPPGYVEAVIRAHLEPDGSKGGLYQRFIEGLFVAVEGGSFAFDYTKHVVDTVDLTRMKYVRCGVDYGWDNPSCILVVGFDGDGRAYVVDEFYKKNTAVDDLVGVANGFKAEYGSGLFICDPTEKQTTQTLRKGGVRARSFEGKREDSIRQLGGRFHLQTTPSTPCAT